MRVLLRLGLLSCGGLATAAFPHASTTLVPFGATWRYLDNGSDPGPSWISNSFDDTAWDSGPAELGYGDGDEATVVGYGPNAEDKHVTTFFRHRFMVADPGAISAATIGLVRDDGAVVYINGTEILRDNVPQTPVPIATTTLASNPLGGADERATNSFAIPIASLAAGTNTICVEIHQALPDSTDISFNLCLTASTNIAITRGPYLQIATTNSIVVRWRTDSATDSRVTFGTDPSNLVGAITLPALTTEHIVAVTNLTPATRYRYAVGTSSAILAVGEDYTFVTAPPTGVATNTRIWAIGDSGTADASARAVRDAYLALAADAPADVWLMLGDNAYENGSDSEFQAAVFETYPTILRNTVAWPTFGNHDSYTSGGAPYFDIFTMPTNGEAGGTPSGTENYYAFDHGNIHFVCLDSQGSSRLAADAMLQWLEDDLAATTQKWIIAFWHHPPYTKGSHDSDAETELIEMRENALPILEAAGTDLVLGGHSHAYERSTFVDGFHSTPTTSAGGTVKSAGSGREDDTGAYQKPNATGNAGTIYAVVGSSGKIGDWTSGSSAITNPVPHPLMFVSLRQYGSMLIDVAGDRLDAKFIDSAGTIQDHFTILKGTTISVAVPDADASESGSDPATLRLLRTGATNFPISVAYALGGTASNGLDYAAISNAQLLAAGATSADIPITPLPDALAEGDESVGLVLSGSVSYTTGPTNVAIATIHDRPLDAWRAVTFGPAAEDPAIGSRLADPDHDAIPNIAEYAMRLDPLTFDPSPSLAVSGTELLFRFQQNGDADDIAFFVEGSDSLMSDEWTTLATFVPGGTWTPLATGIGIAESGLAPAIQVTVSHADFTSRGTRYFFRLRVGP